MKASSCRDSSDSFYYVGDDDDDDEDDLNVVNEIEIILEYIQKVINLTYIHPLTHISHTM